MIAKRPILYIKCLVYNHAPYLRQCLDGIVMQRTNFPFVAIVHDDASTDESASIIREYAKKYPEIIRPIYESENQYSKKNGSLSMIMDRVMSEAKFIALCEGDDYWTDPYKLQKQVDFLIQHEDYVLVSHVNDIYYQESEEWKRNIRGDYPFHDNGCFKVFDYSLDNYFDIGCPQPLTTVYRNGGGYHILPQKYKYYRDTIFYYYLLKQGKGALLQDNMGVYRIHGGGIYSGNTQVMNWTINYKNLVDIYRYEDDIHAVEKAYGWAKMIISHLLSNKRCEDLLKFVVQYVQEMPFKYHIRLVNDMAKHLFRQGTSIE